MTLERDVHSEFADVVGEENLCDDPAMMAAFFKTDFAAVIMPKDTAQVQAVVRLCNKHKLQFRPICTGWTGTFLPGTVLIDLRRMDQIIEINEKNMYAVVEPYVTSAQLQAELFKRGSTPPSKEPDRSAPRCCGATVTWTNRAGPTTATIWRWSGSHPKATS